MAGGHIPHSVRLLEILGQYRRVLVVMHDNPDPDAIAAGWAVHRLVEQCVLKPVRVVAGGAIVRAENKHMVELLAPPIELVTHLEVDPGTATILVDCSCGKINHLVTRSGTKPVAVIDHHISDGEDARIRFRDIRPEVAASASIATSYLREQEIEVGEGLATAVLYALRSEIRGTTSSYSRLDRQMISWLTEQADATKLAQIENAPLSCEYFADLALAMQGTYLHGDSALCFLPRASCTEIVGEVADLLIRCKGIHRVLCAAVVGDDLLLSARADQLSASATDLLCSTLNGLGGCGGHTHRAGGRMPGVGRSGKLPDQLHEEIRARWLRSCGLSEKLGRPLIARREIVDNL